MDFAKCLAEMNLQKHIYEAASATYKALTESESDSRILKMATRLVDNFFTKDTIDEIVGKFEDMESLSVFGTDDDFKVTKELHDPIHVIVTAQLGGSQVGDQRKAETIYHNPPEITLFLSDRTGRLVHQYTGQHGKKYEADRDTLAKGWREVALHEASHALDCIVRGSDKFSRSSKSSLKDNQIHECQSIQVPVMQHLGNHHPVVLGTKQRCAEQSCGEFAILFVLELRHQLLARTSLGIKTLDGLQHKGVYDEAVVVPVEALFLQDLVEVLILHEHRPVESAPEVAVFFISRFAIISHPILVDVRFYDLLVEAAYEVLLVRPGFLLILRELQKLVIRLQLGHKAVFDELGAWRQSLAQSALAALSRFHTPLEKD